MTRYKPNTAIIQGADHNEMGRNCQDFVGARTFLIRLADGIEHPAVVGVVSDGCGEGRRSEVGATLFGEVLLNRLPEDLLGRFHDRVQKREDIAPFLNWYIPATAKSLCLRILNLAGYRFHQNPTTAAAFVTNNLLFTTLFALTIDDTVWVLTAGDGIIHFEWDDGRPAQSIVLDEDNHPQYLGYSVVPDDLLTTPRTALPPPECRVAEGARRVFLATDGAVRFVRERRVRSLFDLKGRALQRMLNSGHPGFLPHQSRRPEWAVKDDASMLLLQIQETDA